MSSKLSTLLKQVNEATAEIVATIQGFDGRIEALQAERQSIGQAPVSRADFIAYLDAMVDKKSGSFGNHVARQLGNINAAFFPMESMGAQVNLLKPYPGGLDVISEEAVYWYLKPAIMARLAELAEAMEFPEKPVALDERRARIAAIDGEIADLRKQRAELAGQLQKAGLVA